MSVYLPEGLLLDTPENIRRTGSAAGLAQAVAGHMVSIAASSNPSPRRTAAPTNGLASSFKSIHRLFESGGNPGVRGKFSAGAPTPAPLILAEERIFTVGK